MSFKIYYGRNEAIFQEIKRVLQENGEDFPGYVDSAGRCEVLFKDKTNRWMRQDKYSHHLNGLQELTLHDIFHDTSKWAKSEETIEIAGRTWSLSTVKEALKKHASWED